MITENSDKAGFSRQKSSCLRRMTRSTRKVPHVMLSNKRGRANTIEVEQPKVEIPDDNMWIQTSYWYRSAATFESERFTMLKESAMAKFNSKENPEEYPIFPPDYFNLEVEDDGTEKFIELKGKETICPGSPGYLPERIPIQKWFQESMWGEDDWRPYRNMVRYSRITSNFRIPCKDAEKQVAEQESNMYWIEKVKWYQSICEDKAYDT